MRILTIEGVTSILLVLDRICKPNAVISTTYNCTRLNELKTKLTDRTIYDE